MKKLALAQMTALVLSSAMISDAKAAKCEMDQAFTDWKGWEYNICIDSMSDEKRTLAWVNNDDGWIKATCYPVRKKVTATFGVKGEYLDNGEFRDLKYRVDSQSAKTFSAWVNDNWYYIDERAHKLLYEFYGAKKIIYRLTSYDYDVYTISMDVSGGDKALRKVLKDCGKKMGG